MRASSLSGNNGCITDGDGGIADTDDGSNTSRGNGGVGVGVGGGRSAFTGCGTGVAHDDTTIGALLAHTTFAVAAAAAKPAWSKL
jgi:hypothetical protein